MRQDLRRKEETHDRKRVRRKRGDAGEDGKRRRGERGKSDRRQKKEKGKSNERKREKGRSDETENKGRDVWEAEGEGGEGGQAKRGKNELILLTRMSRNL